MFTKLRCERFKKEQNRRIAKSLQAVDKAGKLARRIRVTSAERDMDMLFGENARMFSRSRELISQAADIASEMKTARLIHELNCPNH